MRLPQILIVSAAFVAVMPTTSCSRNFRQQPHTISDADIVGTYHPDASAFHSPTMPTMPTNFYAFSIAFSADGSFVATNVPADFFFDHMPPEATPETRGTWKVLHKSNVEPDYLELLCTTTPVPGMWSTTIELNDEAPRISMCFNCDKKDSATFYLLRQK